MYGSPESPSICQAVLWCIFKHGVVFKALSKLCRIISKRVMLSGFVAIGVAEAGD